MPDKILVTDIESGATRLRDQTAEEIADAEQRQQEAAAADAAIAAAISAKQELVGKLRAGTASAEELQQAVADILDPPVIRDDQGNDVGMGGINLPAALPPEP